MLLKIHHAIIDGVGIVILMGSLMDNFDRKAFINYRSFTTLQRIMAFFISPFAFFQMVAQNMQFNKILHNPWKIDTTE